MAGTLQRDPLMPRDLDHDGMVVWYSLGALARWCALPGHEPITAAHVIDWADEHWAELLADTPEVDEPLTGRQRGVLLLTLQDIEAPDPSDDRPWWDR